jgi:HAD superfamily hydrolase (TIGR01509 family)
VARNIPSNNSAIRAVLFDWDGTLLNSYAADTAAYLAMFRAMGIPWGIAELERHYSPNWYRLYRAARLPREHWKRADRVWRLHYAKQRPELLPDAREVLARLSADFGLGLVTSGSRSRVRRQLSDLGLMRVFRARVYGESVAQRKPHPAPLLRALERMRIEASAAIYVGDAPEDIAMARRAGVRAIAVLGPFPTHKRLRAARPYAVLGSVRFLPELLGEMARKASHAAPGNRLGTF